MATTAEESRKNPSKLEQDSFSSHDSEIRRKFQSDNENKEEVEFANETVYERAPIGTRESVTEQKQPEESEPVQKLFSSRFKKPDSHDEFRLLTSHGQSVTAIALADDDLTGFSASKDGTIIQWDVESGNTGEYMWPNKENTHILSIAVSSDGRYLATGGMDSHVHLWDTRTRQHIQALPGHRGPVSCLTFREGASQLISGSYDQTIKLWNVEDRAYMDTLVGHQGEVLTIDCLRKERVLSVGRDRTMRLFKVAEESQLVFRTPAGSLECCCFISNDEILAGSDDGSIKLWNPMRKAPAFIVENAHPVLPSYDKLSANDNKVSNGDDAAGNGNIKAEGLGSSVQSWVSSVAVCRSSDLVASGAGNGSVNLWGIDGEAKTIRPLHDLPLVGFVNSLAFANSGRFLLAGVGQEPRLGTWGRNSAARNGVLIHPLKLSE
ncbi:hypothetical protein MKW92_009278 [Papaver armeniacum]|nr:hypothetical protein MKW92_009278 [Papaver armeniacum]